MDRNQKKKRDRKDAKMTGKTTEQKIEEYRKFPMPLLILSLCGITIILAILGLLATTLAFLNLWIRVIILIFAIVAIVLPILLPMLTRIPWPWYWVIDRGGKLIVKEPGYCIIVRFFGYDRIVNKIQQGIQYGIQLFSDIPEPRIDLAKGGEIQLHDPRIWIIVDDPVAAVRIAVNFEEQLREMSENRVSGALNVLTYEDVMVLRIPKMLLEKQNQKEAEAAKAKAKKMLVEKLDEIVRKSEDINDFVKPFGKVVGFTLDDFNFDDETTRTRRERIITEMQVQIAENEALATTNKMSTMAKTADVLKQAGFPTKMAQEVASERFQDWFANEKGNLRKVVWPGIGVPEISAQWQMGKGVLGPQKKREKEKPQSREERRKKIDEAKW